MSIFDAAIFDSVIFDTGEASEGPTGFIPRGSFAAIEGPERASAALVVPQFTASVTVPTSRAEIE